MSARLSIVAPSLVAPTVVSCNVVSPTVVGPTANAPTDPLSFLDDEFSGSSLDPKWQTYEGSGTIVESVSGGELDLTCDEGGVTGSLWFDGFQGILLYQLVTGDFDAIATCRVRNIVDSGPPTNSDGDYRIAMLAAHDPDHVGALNYVHVGLGSTANNGLRCEWKSTVNGTSVYDDVSAPSGAGQIRLLRVGQLFTAYYRASTLDAWTEVQAMDRSVNPLPDTVQLGFGVYASLSTHDLRLFVNNFRVTTPS